MLRIIGGVQSRAQAKAPLGEWCRAVAATCGATEVARALLKENPNLDLTNRRSNSAAQIARLRKHTAMVTLLNRALAKKRAADSLRTEAEHALIVVSPIKSEPVRPNSAVAADNKIREIFTSDRRLV